jgi:hypothetical protein
MKTHFLTNVKQKDDKKELIKTLLKEILYNSLGQAVIKIIYSPNLVLKIFLLISVLVSTCFASFFVINAFICYFTYGVSTMTRTIFETPTLFPKVTFCNSNKFTTEYAFKLKQTSDEIDDRFFTNEEKRKLGHDLNDILIECWFNFKPCNASDFVWSFHRTYGNCYVFNAGTDSNKKKIDLKKTTIGGVDYGLSVTLYVNFYEKLMNYVNESGLVIRIGNSSYSMYYGNNGVFLSPGMSSYIVVDREFKSILPKPYSNCEIDSNSLSYSYLYNLIVKSNYAYTQQLCIMQCYQDYIIKNYNCSIYYHFSLFNASPCDPIIENNLLETIDLNGSFISNKCASLCPLECNQTLYKTLVTTNKLNGNELYVMKIKNNSKLASDFINRTIDSKNARKSFATVYVFYESLSYTLSNETPQMDGVSLFGSIGGNLSLFLGVSLFSLCEIIELIMELIFIRKNICRIE